MNARSSLHILAERGLARGATSVLAEARRRLEGDGSSSGGSRPKRAGLVGPSRRAFALAIVGTLTVLGGTLLWMSRERPGPEPPAQTVAPTTSTTTTGTVPEPETEAPDLGLVPRQQWPSSATAPVLSLPACEDPDALAAFMTEEFPEAAGHEFQTADPIEVATRIVVPRIGHLSLFTIEDAVGACFAAGRRGETIGWWFGTNGGDHMARAAARDRVIIEVPTEAAGPPGLYAQEWDSLGDGFTGTVFPTGRVQVVVGPRWESRYAVIEFGIVLPDSDHLSTYIARSLAVAYPTGPPPPTHVLSESETPRLLPERYGPCLVTPLLLQPLSGVYCTPTGDYIEVFARPFTDASPPRGATTSPTRVGVVSGHTWVDGDRRTVIVSLDRTEGDPWAVWATGPAALDDGALEAVLGSLIPLSPEVITPRRGSGPPSDASVDGLMAAVERAGATSVIESAVDPLAPFQPIEFSLTTEIDGTLFVTNVGFDELPGDRAAFASMLLITEVAAVGPIDVLVDARYDAVQVLFACGEVWFNSSFDRTGERPFPVTVPAWADDLGRRASILEFIKRFIEEIGCGE